MAQNGFLIMLAINEKKRLFFKQYIFQEWCPSHAGGAPGLFHHGATPERSTQVNIRTDCLELERWQPQSIPLSSSPFSLQLVLIGRVNSTHLTLMMIFAQAEQAFIDGPALVQTSSYR